MRWCVALLLPALISAQSLSRRINAAIVSTPEARQAHWGIRVVDLLNGAVIFSHNENRFFTPASNTKLFTTALAMMRLGPDHEFVTRVVADPAPDPQGRVQELRLIGGGDPNLSARVLPYKRGAQRANAFEAIEAFADAVVATGVREVTGDITGDDTAYLWEPYPDGWSADDPTWEYGAPVSALVVNDNAFKLTASPGEQPGDPARLTIWPTFESLVVHNRTRTSTFETKIVFYRLAGSTELVVSGPIAKTDITLLAIDDPAYVAAQLFRDALQKRGVTIRGNVRARHRVDDDTQPPASSTELARRTSVPLLEDLRVVNKESQNLHAEIALREVARVKNGVGSVKGGLEELKIFLTEIGIAEKQYAFYDGSGLSRMTLVTPATVTTLLQFMYGTQHREAWMSTLPIGAVDGTLYNRFANNRRARNILAKTGAISHVAALSGYAQRNDGKTYAFSILVNHFNGERAALLKLVDRIALSLLS